MAIIDDLKAIGTMMGIKPTGNNIMEVVKSMKAQLEEKKIPVSKEIKKFTEDVTKEHENQDAPTVSSEIKKFSEDVTKEPENQDAPTVSSEIKKFTEDVTKEPENQDAPTVSSEKKNRKKNKEFKESTVPTVKFN